MREFKEHKKPSVSSDTFFKARVQPKLQVGQPGDAFEQEADSVADAVVSKSGKNDIQKSGNPEEEKVQKKPIAESISSVQMKELKDEEPPVQKKEEEEQPLQKKEEEEPVQKKEEEDPALQKKEDEEPVMKKDEEKLQKKSTNSTTTSPKNSLETRLSYSKGKGSKLGGSVKSEMESGFGSSFEKVNIHTDDQAVKMNQELGAQAFTHGSDIYFNQSKYDPNSVEGKTLLAHELTHTVQQEGAEEKGSIDASANDVGLEKDANESTKGIMRKLLEGGRNLGEKIMPKLKSGLRISRCEPDKKTVEQETKDSEVKAPEVAKSEKVTKLTEYEQWKKDNDPKVKDVKSLAEEDLAAKKITAETDLEVRKSRRIDDIKTEIKTIEDFLATLKTKPKSYTDRLAALEIDKKKTDQQIYDLEDSKDVAPDRRKQIIKAMNTVKITDTQIAEAKKNWHQYDDKFTGSEELMNVLKEIQMEPADLKAMVGQESGDLMLGNDQDGDIAGIAQIGPNETVAVGNKAEDRKDTNKAILIAAKVLRMNINNAGITPSMFSTIDDYKCMAFAAYNAGGNAIKQSIASTKNNKTWAGLITGDAKSGLYIGLNKTLPKLMPSKFTEVKTYVQRIFKRLGK